MGSKLINALGFFGKKLSSEVGLLMVWLLSFTNNSQDLSLPQEMVMKRDNTRGYHTIKMYQKVSKVKKTIDNYNYEKEETILIGDAMTDYNASFKNGIKFYGYNNLKLKKYDYIENFQEFNP